MAQSGERGEGRRRGGRGQRGRSALFGRVPQRRGGHERQRRQARLPAQGRARAAAGAGAGAGGFPRRRQRQPQLVPEERVAALEVRVVVHVAVQLGVQAARRRVVQQHHDEARRQARVAQRVRRRLAELGARPARVHVVLRQQDDGPPRRRHRLRDLPPPIRVRGCAVGDTGARFR